jgi:hypothetical protein
MFLLLGLWGAAPAPAQEQTNAQEQITDLKSEMDTAIEQVKKIVNQPVTCFARTARMRVGTFPTGWFHEGANKPDFNRVDVRTTQEAIYDKYEYVTSNLNPGMVFIGRELEFNANTKYFYVNRSLPKKKLSQAEMIEINRLYRIIGRCDLQLARLQTPKPSSMGDSDNSEPGAAPEKRPRLLNPYAGGGLLLVALLVLYFSRRKA